MRIVLNHLCCVALVLSAVRARAVDKAVTLHVRPDGNDARSGASPTEALATLQRARDAIRARQPLTAGAVVLVAPGNYSMTNTLEFTAEDSGPDGKRIIYRAADPRNKPRFSAGRGHSHLNSHP